MAKKSRKNRKDHNVVHPAFEHHDHDWHPLDEEINGRRDQKYVKNIKPRSDGQAELMEAIDTYSLTLAMGPAGTGKTYLAIAKAAGCSFREKGVPSASKDFHAPHHRSSLTTGLRPHNFCAALLKNIISPSRLQE